MKLNFFILAVSFTTLFACNSPKTPPPPPQTMTIDDMTFALPDGFKLSNEGNKMTYEGINAIENEYQKMDGSNTASLKINRLDVAHMATEDPNYVTDLCLSQHRVFYSEGFENEYKYSEATPLSIGGKTGKLLTFNDLKDPKHPLKGEMLAVKCGQKIIILHYTDFADHFEKSKEDWEVIKNSVVVN